ncbi:MAG: glycoside hydrolase family 97 catalytic domain-containing protein, partial [Tannerella sp.]|nr:glycoside hydrolase family 97 catalytic domain-containing protein [Tannerella sp.]
MNRKLKTFVLIWCMIAILSGCGGTDKFTVCSPDGKLALRVSLDGQGCMFYNIIRNDSLLFQASPLGVSGTDSANTFTENLTFVKASASVIDETYSLPVGKTRLYHNRCNEKCFHFRNAAGNVLQLECRAYGDGVAFRYVIEKEDNIGIVSENTRFNLSGNAVTWMMNYRTDYENFYPRRRLADIGKERLSYPALIQTGEHWLLLSEANVYNHPATHLRKTADGALTVVFPEDSFTVDRRYESPWRTFIIGDKLNTIVESTLVENLNPPSVIPDTSWIEPGVAVFPWWGNFMANSYIDTLKSYVDLAAEMDWKWIEFDVSLVGNAFKSSKEWETTPWLKDFTDYARSKGICVYGWDEIKELNTKEKRDHIYGRYRDLGIRGIKIDYIGSDRLDAMRFREVAMKEAADYGLMVSFHGETAPRGQRRKYPNLMTCEGVKGAEYYALSRTQSPNPAHNCTLPFTRNVVGSMDYTPVTFTVRKENPRITTYAHELALPFIYESGWTVMADRPEAYLQSLAKELLKKVKATWDET